MSIEELSQDTPITPESEGENVFKAPPGKFRVIVKDLFKQGDHQFSKVKDFDIFEEAEDFCDTENRKRESNIDPDFAVYDERASYRHGPSSIKEGPHGDNFTKL